MVLKVKRDALLRRSQVTVRTHVINNMRYSDTLPFILSALELFPPMNSISILCRRVPTNVTGWMRFYLAKKEKKKKMQE